MLYQPMSSPQMISMFGLFAIVFPPSFLLTDSLLRKPRPSFSAYGRCIKTAYSAFARPSCLGIGADVPDADVIGHDDEDIGFFLFLFCHCLAPFFFCRCFCGISFSASVKHNFRYQSIKGTGIPVYWTLVQ